MDHRRFWKQAIAEVTLCNLDDRGAVPKVSIIIPDWNVLEDTAEFLESLKKTTHPNYGVIIIDSCKTDRTELE